MARARTDIPQLPALWDGWATRRDGEARAALMLAYWPLVKEVAAGVSAGLPPHVEEADLISAGLFGLLSALDRFEPEDERPFEPFARMRIRGAIIDEMRALDWAPRRVRERARQLHEATSALEQKLHRQATRDEVARALGLTPREVHSRLARNLLASVAALDGEMAADAGSDPVRLIDTLEDQNADDPARALAEAELRLGVVEAIVALPWRDRRILTLHYVRTMPFREIGERLGISESRVSQLHATVIRRLRDEIQLLLAGDAFPLRTVVEATAEALERLEPFQGLPLQGADGLGLGSG